MRQVYDTEAVYAAEADLMTQVPGEHLMSRAADGLAATIREALAPGGLTGRHIVVLAGSGNNGGDALFAGARLAHRGLAVTAIQVADSWHPAAAAALQRAGGRMLHASSATVGTALADAEVVIDGIVGIGARGPVREPARTLLQHIPRSACTVAVDLPSGVDPDTGAITDDDASVRADLTVTFGCYKPAHFLPPGRDACGIVELVDIGLAAAADRQRAQFAVLELVDVAQHFGVPHAADAYKYSHGVLGVVSGCAQYPGAPHMVIGAARHCGVGMVRLWQDLDAPQVSAAVVTRFPDTVTVTAPIASDERATAWVAGPGMGTDSAAAGHVAAVLATGLPVVIDADALTLVSRTPTLRSALSARPATTVVTPHVGEFARLGFAIDGDDRVAAAERAATELSAIVVLKGPGTVITDGNDTYVDVFGTAALATAGTGDALAGIVGAALASHPANPVAAVAAAVAIHGLAGRIASAGGRPTTAWDVVQAVPDAVMRATAPR